MAAWALALGCVGLESILPGSVSMRLPLYPLLIGLVLVTILGGRSLMAPAVSWTRWVSATLLVCGVVGVLGVMGLTQSGTVAIVGTGLAIGVAIAWLAGWAFVAQDESIT